MKRIISIVMAVLLAMMCVSTISAKEQTKASGIANEFISDCSRSGMKEWSGFTAVDEDPLYDSKLNIVGYDVHISDGNNNGYIFVVNDNEGPFVIEASIDGESPYRNKNAEMRVYAGPSNYYSFCKDGNYAISLVTGEEIPIEDIKPLFSNLNLENKVVQGLKASNTGSLTLSSFETIYQESSYKCIPTSFAMAMKYLHNTSQSVINSSYYTDGGTLRDTLFNYMNGSTSGCFTPHIDNGLYSFTSSYCNHALRCFDGVWYSDMVYNTIVGEIDGDYPSVIIFPPGSFSYGNTSNHACTSNGYFYNTTGSYVRVVDPIDGLTKMMSWSTVIGYFVIYVY